VDGKVIRPSLETEVWAAAKLRLVDFLKQHQEARGCARAISFAEAIACHYYNNTIGTLRRILDCGVRGVPETGTKNSEIRRVPIIQDLERLLEKRQRERGQTGPILNCPGVRPVCVGLRPRGLWTSAEVDSRRRT